MAGLPATTLEAPVLAGGRVAGVVTLFTMRRATYAPEQVRLLYTLANQLGAAAERLTG